MLPFYFNTNCLQQYQVGKKYLVSFETMASWSIYSKQIDYCDHKQCCFRITMQKIDWLLQSQHYFRITYDVEWCFSWYGVLFVTYYSCYRIAQNSGGGKLWRIECHSPIFYPTKFISIFVNSRLPDKSLHMHE